MLIFKHNFSPYNSTNILQLQNKSLFYRNWYNNDVILVKQFFKKNGHLFNCCFNYHNIPVNAKVFIVLFDAIPNGPIQLLSDNISSESIPFS